MSLRDFKIPNFKFPKLKMKDIENIEEVNVEIDPKKINERNKKHEYYPETNYKTIKEIFNSSIEKYSENIFALEKQDHKEPYKEITYKQFGEDVVGLGTAITKFLNLKDEKIAIIGETSYCWYTSYLALLCGAGIAVPLDKELPANEIENLINRSNTSAVIYSKKKKDVISKIQDNLPSVKYFIEMNSDDKVQGRNVGYNYVLEEGKKIVKNGDNSFNEIEIDPEEFRLLIFTLAQTREWRISDRHVEDGSYLKLKTINLAYNFGSPCKGIENLTVFGTVNNVFTITGYSWYDPDVNTFGQDASRRGVDIYSYPASRTFSLGVKVTL